MAALSIISTLATGIGALVQAQGTIAAGKAAQSAAYSEAAQLEAKGKQEQAAAQQEAGEKRRNKELALSSLQSRAAASGFSATDPTALALAGEIQKYGTFQEQVAQYGGNARRAGMEAQAVSRRMEGDAAMKGARYSAMGTILGGISGMATRWGGQSTTGSSFRYGGGGGSYGFG